MSTEEDGHTLTRKQLRELRLTGSTPVINDEQAAAAPAAPSAEQKIADENNGSKNPSGAKSTSTAESTAPAAADDSSGAPAAAPLTRRAAREQERIKTGSLPIVVEPVVEEPVVEEPVVEEPVVAETVVEEPVVDEPADAAESTAAEEQTADATSADEPSAAESPADERPELVSGVPSFAPMSAPAPRFDGPLAPASPDDEDGDAATPPAAAEGPAVRSTFQPVDPAGQPRESAAGPGEIEGAEEHPKVGAAFGIGVKRGEGSHSAPRAFDELLESGSAGPSKTASTLIFTPSADAGSLSGPVASTGELLITGSYAFPEGMGSQGHALGTTDGKDVDAVLIDGELAPSSSPTPIAASSAISTSKPAGEVIRPPVPDKSNKLTLTLAIVAGGLALALAAALIIAFISGVLG